MDRLRVAGCGGEGRPGVIAYGILCVVALLFVVTLP